MRFVCVSALLLFLSACSSETEKKAMNEISETFGGNIQITKGYAASTKETSGKYCELVLTNANLFHEGVNRKGVSGAMAACFYKHLTDEERKAYDRVDIILKDGSKYEETFKYNTTALSCFYKQQQKADEYIGAMLLGNLQDVRSKFYPLYRLNQDSFNRLFMPFTSASAGHKSKYTTGVEAGVYTLKDSSKQFAVGVTGLLIKDSLRINYSLIMDTLPHAENIIGFRYSY